MNFVPGGTIEWTGELLRILREKKEMVSLLIILADMNLN